MRTLISPRDERVKFKTTKHASEVTGLTVNRVRQLIYGLIFSYRGWKSVHKRQKKSLKKYYSTCAYVNTKTKECIRLTSLVGSHKIKAITGIPPGSMNEISCGHRLAQNHWVLKTTYDLLYGADTYSKVTWL